MKLMSSQSQQNQFTFTTKQSLMLSTRHWSIRKCTRPKESLCHGTLRESQKTTNVRRLVYVCVLPYHNLNLARKNNIEEVMQAACAKVTEWAQINCKNCTSNPIGGGATGEQREKTLAHILTYDISEKEQEWLDYHNEEAQIKLDLSDMILDVLLDECADSIHSHSNIS